MNVVLSKSNSLINYIFNNSNHSIKSLSKILSISEKKLISQEGLTKKELRSIALLQILLKK